MTTEITPLNSNTTSIIETDYLALATAIRSDFDKNNFSDADLLDFVTKTMSQLNADKNKTSFAQGYRDCFKGFTDLSEGIIHTDDIIFIVKDVPHLKNIWKYEEDQPCPNLILWCEGFRECYRIICEKIGGNRLLDSIEFHIIDGRLDSTSGDLDVVFSAIKIEDKSEILGLVPYISAALKVDEVSASNFIIRTLNGLNDKNTIRGYQFCFLRYGDIAGAVTCGIEYAVTLCPNPDLWDIWEVDNSKPCEELQSWRKGICDCYQLMSKEIGGARVLNAISCEVVIGRREEEVIAVRFFQPVDTNM